MALKFYKPTTPARRHASVDAFLDVTKKEPEKSFIMMKKRMGGRNAQGKITVRHRGGGARRYIRVVDFRQEKYDMPAKVLAIEYDPNRGPRIALIEYADKVRSYILAPQDLGVGDEISSSKAKISIKPGNRMPLEFIPVGVMVHNLELFPGKGGQVIRGAGLGAQIMAMEGDYALIKLPSGEIRKFNKKCMASVGMLGNPDARLVRVGKAGTMRNLGWKPTVRGKAMNPADHPHGGGEGHNPIGMKFPKTKWGKHALGVKTRKPKKWSNKFIIQRRKR
jgi:large subunit ribosomal protein L2